MRYRSLTSVGSKADGIAPNRTGFRTGSEGDAKTRFPADAPDLAVSLACRYDY